ncbi:MAG: hypothetical protein JWL69_1366 [Phycisphaerales bacterium]|nr:hypothetical protein [Phycisphaerales bacterium]MDB5353737.1 hypothetical protein [Phycisphaerales bacterium]
MNEPLVVLAVVVAVAGAMAFATWFFFLRKLGWSSAAQNTVVKVPSRGTPPAMKLKYQAGQVWTYRTRPGEKASRLTIVKVEPHGDGTAVHVHISRVSIINPAAPKGKSTFISHMPFAEEAIDRSVLQLVDQSEKLPAFEEGYATWKEQADKGKAGVFTIRVAEAIEGIASAFKGNRRAANRQ